MKVIKPSTEVLSPCTSGIEVLANLEAAGRTCYKSEHKITGGSAKEFVGMLIRRGHESVLEHEKMTVRVICDRGVSHELVRHRIASFSQESTRYVNYNKKGMEFILPPWFGPALPEGEYTQETLWKLSDPDQAKPGLYPGDPIMVWLTAMLQAEEAYKILTTGGWTPQQARSVLPNSLKTEVVITANLREWRLIFKQRTAGAAHPQMREIMQPLLDKFKSLIPVVFDDITYEGINAGGALI